MYVTRKPSDVGSEGPDIPMAKHLGCQPCLGLMDNTVSTDDPGGMLGAAATCTVGVLLMDAERSRSLKTEL